MDGVDANDDHNKRSKTDSKASGAAAIPATVNPGPNAAGLPSNEGFQASLNLIEAASNVSAESAAATVLPSRMFSHIGSGAALNGLPSASSSDNPLSNIIRISDDGDEGDNGRRARSNSPD